MNTILPTYKKDNSETGCCSRFDPEPWDEKEFELQNKLFAKAKAALAQAFAPSFASVVA